MPAGSFLLAFFIYLLISYLNSKIQKLTPKYENNRNRLLQIRIFS